MTAVDNNNDADEIAEKKIVITDVYDKMLKKNTTNSKIKTEIEN